MSRNSKEYEGKLVKFLIEYLSIDDFQLACEKTGVSRKVKEIIVARLNKTSTLAAVPSPGPPVKYTDYVCQCALDILAENPDAQLTLQELLGMLEEEMVVDPPTNRDTFSKHLKDYVASTGGFINTMSRKTIFFLASNDHSLRVRFCKEAVKVFKDKRLSDTAFIDETIVEESPHPKGESL
jgi:hypothetical protein